MSKTLSEIIDQSIGSLPVTFGNRYFVDANGNGGDGSKRDFTFTSLTSAEDACVTNNEDQILLSANSTHSLSSGLDMDKNRIQVIGLDGGERLVQQGFNNRPKVGRTHRSSHCSAPIRFRQRSGQYDQRDQVAG